MKRSIQELEEKCFIFAKACRNFCKQIPKTMSNIEYSKQLIRSSASVGANYIEANEALGKGDFKMRLKISKKEAKESRYWIRLIETPDTTQQSQLMQEAMTFMKIFGAILTKYS